MPGLPVVKKILFRLLVAISALYLVLLIPDRDPGKVQQPAGHPFTWNRDAFWKKLEADYSDVRSMDRAIVRKESDLLFDRLELGFKHASKPEVTATDTSFMAIADNFFAEAALVAAHPEMRDSLLRYCSKMRKLVKEHSALWDFNERATRDAVYALLYGMRAAVEEVLLQTDTIPFNAVLPVMEESSSTPAVNILGIPVHSGDLLLSRGGAEVSALISRGNDYPGNFSHVALVYVDDKTGKASLVEAHIERGVAISSVEQYLKDTKLRFMVMRPKAALPQLVKDPFLPQQAARLAYEEALSRHIPYDFKMDFNDSSALFCSEVASFAYKKMGIRLWQYPSVISSAGAVNWLHAFGVEHFVTQMPSDLEYEPQLSVVAEWRDPETLWKDHMDNAVMDVLFEKADAGLAIGYDHWKLPLVRVVKLWCMAMNLFGKTAIIPEGMSATQALKNQRFVEMYKRLKERTEAACKAFRQTHHYNPPYWEMVSIARASF